MPNIHSPSLDSVEAGAPGNKIKITPEMIEAGVKIIRTCFDQPNDLFTKLVVEEIIRAIEEARLESS